MTIAIPDDDKTRVVLHRLLRNLTAARGENEVAELLTSVAGVDNAADVPDETLDRAVMAIRQALGRNWSAFGHGHSRKTAGELDAAEIYARWNGVAT